MTEVPLEGEFRIERDFIAYAVAGGDYEYVTCLNLLVDGVVVRTVTGMDSETPVPGSWNVTDLAGRKAQLQVRDVQVAHVVQTDDPAVPPVRGPAPYGERHRPQFHFTARQFAMQRLNPGMRQEGWLNDLNGLVCYEGEYHLFAQRWNKCWIHAVSNDLVHWEELEPAFFEEALDIGVQSGSVVIDYGNTSGLSDDAANPAMVAFWSRNDNQSQCLSYSLDRGRTWQHYPGNPIMVKPERDPKVFRYGSHWVMFLYGDQQYYILTSTDLLHWTDTGNVIPNSFECPDFFELPLPDGTRKWVLVRGDGRYSIGSFDGRQFTEESDQLRSDSGANFYATQTWNNTETGDGRRIQAAWMRDGVYPDMPFNQQVTFPCELTLRPMDGVPRLFRNPIAELATLRSGTTHWSGKVDLAHQLTTEPAELDLELETDLPADVTLTIDVSGTPIDLTRSQIGDARLSGRLRTLRVLIDRTSIEVFANDGEVSVSRCYLPTGAGIVLRSTAAVQVAVDLHTLRSIWESQVTA
ncbi:glycoside hydrolase family 32 protein [Kribbella sandramycini]|uniref:Glycoside hydrolase family 32 protein n=1 Tax=Kribbella sandramycini TaxID=60450 RepID=A0A7Y4KXG6_9ACTN|nr:glycoside hydrolase family 32 protein [Kribbella sandramycini]MBB6569717.1 sucrose-6-phosphate hydrolase SacC (GH32 family) [Kribbella sandramycini]NOL40453.1 glycoside hydrolase family 32 protein [Kribbella sandramycini]